MRVVMRLVVAQEVWRRGAGYVLGGRVGRGGWARRQSTGKRGNEVVVVGKMAELEEIGETAGQINWYPGHIAKAERQLVEYLKRVDVVIEARDARIASTTAHPDVLDWCGPRPRIVVYTFSDLAADACIYDWKVGLKKEGEEAYFIDAKRGKGDVHRIRAALRAAGKKVNEKRAKKHIKPRAARCAVIGYPNVGKSALINKLAGRAAAKSENRAGVTRALQWVRPRGVDDLELLDSPGIIPSKHVDQTAAARLAMCGDVGASAYDARLVAEALVATLRVLPAHYAPQMRNRVKEKYAMDLEAYDPDHVDDFIEDLADKRFASDVQVTSAVLLADFRNGKLGKIALEPPPYLRAKFYTKMRDNKLGLIAPSPPAIISGLPDGSLLLPDHSSSSSSPASSSPGRPGGGSSSYEDNSSPSPDPALLDDDDADMDRRLAQGDFTGW